MFRMPCFVLSVIVWILSFLPSEVQAQLLDIESNSQAVVLPRMTELQRDAINPKIVGMLIYQTDQMNGYYYYEGSQWVFMGSGTSNGSQVTINGMAPSTFNLSFMGQSHVSRNGNRFVSAQGFYVDIWTTDSLAHETFYYLQDGCAGNAYLEAARIGKGGLINGNNQLYYVSKSASIVPSIQYKSRLIFNPGQPPTCNEADNTREMMYLLTVNNSAVTGINLNPAQSYCVAY